MNRIIRGALGATAFIGLSTTAVLAHATEKSYKIADLTITAPWARATPAGAKVAGGYVRITNAGKEPDRLVGASIAVAGRAEIHEMTVKDGVMRMQGLEKGLEIKPGESVELKPGGFHLMFMDLSGGLKEGETVKGTLIFEKAGTLPVEFKVAPIGAQGGGDGHRH